MITVTKIFRFETAHALYGYEGPCRQIHGHSYELHVTVSSPQEIDGFLGKPGFVMDFRKLKDIVNREVISLLDHRLLLSGNYLDDHPAIRNADNLLETGFEPTSENLLIFIKSLLIKGLPDTVRLRKLKLSETATSYAEWNG